MSKKTVDDRSRNMIPDYEHLFREDAVPANKIHYDKHGKRRSKFIKKIVKADIWRLILAFLLYIIKASPTWVTPVLTAKIIDIADAGIAAGGFTPEITRELIIYSCVMAVFILQNIPMHMLQMYVMNKVLRGIGAGLRSSIVRKLQHLSITYHKEIETGTIQSKFQKDIEGAIGLFSNLYNSLVPAIIGAIISTFIAIDTSPIVTLFFVVVIPINLLLVSAFRKKIKQSNHMYRVEYEQVSTKLTNMLSMLPVTKAHGLENEEVSQFDDRVRHLNQRGYVVDRVTASFGSTSWVVSQMLSALCLVFCVLLAIKGMISVGDIVLCQSLFATINGNVSAIINIVPILSSGFESVNSIAEIMTASEVEDDTGKLSVSGIEGRVRFENVYYKYPNGSQYVVENFNLDVKKGECIAVVGASGSGKSTIMNLIIGFLVPTQGHLYIDDYDITNLALSQYRRFISVVPQNSILFSGTIKENITYGLSGIDDKRIAEVAEMANLNEFVDELPDGLNTNIGEHGDKLSGGQKQRITIARALIRDPSILILDEATSALDNISEYHVQKAISKLIKGRTTFIVAHRLSTIRDADRIIVMEAGKCVEIGTYDELVAKKGKFYELKNLNDMNYKMAEEELS